MKYYIIQYSRSMFERMQRMLPSLIDEDTHVCFYEYTSDEPHELNISAVSEDEFLKHYK